MAPGGLKNLDIYKRLIAISIIIVILVGCVPTAAALDADIVIPRTDIIVSMRPLDPVIVLANKLFVNVTASTPSPALNAPSTITVTVRYYNDSPVKGAAVTLTKTGGTLSEMSGTTNNYGVFTSAFTSSLPGAFTITAAASKTNYTSGSASIQVSVANDPPVAKFIASNMSGDMPLKVSFDASGSMDPDGSIVQYSWDFGDGGTDSGIKVSHTYETNGSFLAALTVTDNLGMNNTSSAQIVVNAPVIIPSPTAAPPVDATMAALLLIGALVVLAVVGFLLYLLFVKRTLVVRPDAPEAVCDGKAQVQVKVWFVNGFGGAVRQRSDVEVEMKATSGSVKNVTIPENKEYAKATLVAGNEFGRATITAKAGGKAAKADIVYKADRPVFEITVAPESLPADGKSAANVTLKLKDANNNPVAPLEEMTVDLNATVVNVKWSVKIPPKAVEALTSMTATDRSGTSIITAVSGNIRGEGKITLEGMPKRFCMHCGTPMTMEAEQCPRCGLTPPSGVDTKQCTTCGTVIPEAAKFCYKDGARQPEIARPQQQQGPTEVKK
jgi:PKD repeat protein/RNA polymerase subunit RPABC4/transcription elongation factor Spt4